MRSETEDCFMGPIHSRRQDALTTTMFVVVAMALAMIGIGCGGGSGSATGGSGGGSGTTDTGGTGGTGGASSVCGPDGFLCGATCVNLQNDPATAARAAPRVAATRSVPPGLAASSAAAAPASVATSAWPRTAIRPTAADAERRAPRARPLLERRLRAELRRRHHQVRPLSASTPTTTPRRAARATPRARPARCARTERAASILAWAAPPSVATSASRRTPIW